MVDARPVRIAVVDDHPAIIRGAVIVLRERLGAVDVVAAASGVDELIGMGPQAVDVVVLDVVLGDGSDPPQNVERLVAQGLRVLLYTQDHRRGVLTLCLRNGAMGIVSKESEAELAEAVAAVASGQPWFSPAWAAAVESDPEWSVPDLAPRESEALRLYAVGLPLKSVARRMGVSQDTVREYLTRVRRKYTAAGRHANTKTDMYFVAVEDGLLPPDRPTWS